MEAQADLSHRRTHMKYTCVRWECCALARLFLVRTEIFRLAYVYVGECLRFIYFSCFHDKLFEESMMSGFLFFNYSYFMSV